MSILAGIAVIAGIVLVVFVIGAVVMAPPDRTKYQDEEDEENEERNFPRDGA